MKGSLATHDARLAVYRDRQAARPKVRDPEAGGRVRRRRQAEYRAAMAKRKHGPFRTRLTAPTKTRRRGGHKPKRPPVTTECRMARCEWTGTARSWRAARRDRDEHQATKHRKGSAA